jgi:predicted component of type VI protein secretion system
MVFSGGSERNLRLLETTISDAIRDWEPRVEALAVHAEPDLEAPEYVKVSVEYLIRATNTKANLVFPYYLATLEPS